MKKKIAKGYTKKRVTLTTEDVLHVAKLANLDLKKEEIKKFQKQLSSILDYVSQLQEVNTSKVEPTSQVTGLENVFREDEIKQSLSKKETLSNTKSKYNNYFKVKSIF